jgi:hypothetical protein
VADRNSLYKYAMASADHLGHFAEGCGTGDIIPGVNQIE